MLLVKQASTQKEDDYFIKRKRPTLLHITSHTIYITGRVVLLYSCPEKMIGVRGRGKDEGRWGGRERERTQRTKGKWGGRQQDGKDWGEEGKEEWGRGRGGVGNRKWERGRVR